MNTIEIHNFRYKQTGTPSPALIMTIAFVLISCLLLPQSLKAESTVELTEQEILCPAVYPCDGKGGVLSDFRGGSCGERFAAMCAYEVCSNLSDEYTESEKENAILKTKLNKLRRRMRRMKNLKK